MTACNYRQGEIVLVPFPFTDKNATKERPALIVSVGRYHSAYGLCILVPLTSNLNNPAPNAILLKGQERAAAGLPKDSLILPHIIMTLDPARIVKPLGRLSPAVLTKVKTQIIHHFR